MTDREEDYGDPEVYGEDEREEEGEDAGNAAARQFEVHPYIPSNSPRGPEASPENSILL